MKIDKKEFETVLREAVYMYAYNGSNKSVTDKVISHVIEKLFTTQTIKCSTCGYDYKRKDGYCKDCNLL